MSNIKLTITPRLYISQDELFTFIKLAQRSTYAAHAPFAKSERKDFLEYTFEQGKWSYRDSFYGYYRSWGNEVVRYNGEIVWMHNYGGGMQPGKYELTSETFTFLQSCLALPEPTKRSLRGPKLHIQGDWKYTFSQEGDVSLFFGLEEIHYKKELIFFHQMMGGIQINR